MNNKQVLLINWDCYPSQTSGGVYTWTKILIETMSDWDFVVINQLSNPNSNREYEIPTNVTRVIELPIYGTNRYDEFYNDGKPFLGKISRTTDDIIKNRFIPLFHQLVSLLILPNPNQKQLITCICNLQEFFSNFDIKKCVEHPSSWEVFVSVLCTEKLFQSMSLKESWSAYQQITRALQILSINVPKVDLVHCSLAWMPSLLAIIAKQKYSVPIIITEHGVAFRELSLFYNGHIFDNPSKIFWKTVAGNIVNLLYSVADVITPVCSFNANWEQTFGVDPSKINVIYNGVNTQKFIPLESSKDTQKPTIVCMSRIDIFKDIICTIKAVKLVKEQIPNVRCLIYGGSKDLSYSQRCLDEVNNLGLDETVSFMGPTKEPESAYNLGDVVVMSSVTEGFPFSIIEAMACKKTVIASEVGGVAEALKDCGVLVRPRQPSDLANAIIRLLKSPKLRDYYGKKAFDKVRKNFTLEQCASHYEKQYARLVEPQTKNTVKSNNCDSKDVLLLE